MFRSLATSPFFHPQVAALSALLLVTAVRLQAQAAPLEDPASLLRRGSFAEALTLTKQLLKLHPDDGRLWLDRGLAEEGLGEVSAAEKSLRQALTTDPTLLPAAQAGAQIAYRAHSPKAPASSPTFFALTLRAPPRMPCSAFSRSSAATAPSPSASSTKPASSRPATPPPSAASPAAAQRRVIPPPPRRRLAACMPRRPPNLTLELAADQLQAHHPEQTMALLASNAATLPVPALNLLASAYAAADNVPAAIDTYRTAITRDPADETNYLDLATVSMDHQSPEVALSALDAGLRTDPHATRLLLMRGSVYAQLGKDDLAQQDFEQADRLAPNSAFGTLGMGVLVREQSNLDQAQAVLERKLSASKESSDNPVLCFMLADVRCR